MTSPLNEAEADRLLAPLAQYPRLALAVSGGPDSLALLHLAAAWCRRPSHHPSSTDSPCRLFVLTVDHGLRPQSRSEAVNVGEMARSLGLVHSILPWHHSGIDGGVQARARQARYELMADYCAAHDIPALVTAHHLDDQAETFLMRLKRGSGLDGLAAIPAQGRFAGLTLLRPLLDVSKARLIATAKAAGLSYITDPSNLDTRFERGRMREAQDALARLGLTAESIALSARRLRRARQGLEAVTDRFLEDHSKPSAAGFASVPLDALRAAPQEVALRAIGQLIGTIGGAREPVRLAKLEVLHGAIMGNPRVGQTLGGCHLVCTKGSLFVFRELRKQGQQVLAVHPGECRLWDNRFRITLGPSAATPLTVRALGEDGLKALSMGDGFAQTVPRLAARSLPSCWRGEELLCLPRFNYASQSSALPWSGHEATIDCKASFLWR